MILALDTLGANLYNQYGALALGWVAALSEALYIIFLHNRINSIWRTHSAFAAKVFTDIQPYLSKQTETLVKLIELETSNNKDIGLLSDRNLLMMGKLGMVINEIQVSESAARLKDDKNDGPA